MEERRKCSTVRQVELMVRFLAGHRELALGRLRSREARAVAETLWRELTEMLNVEGPARTGKEWAKIWNDHKTRVRAKLIAIKASLRAPGGTPTNVPTLTPLDESVANILGSDFDPLAEYNLDKYAFSDEIEERRSRCSTVRQLELMVRFLEGHRDLALGRLRTKEARAVAEPIWRQLTEILNAEGPARTEKQWAKVWNDHKSRVRAKIVAIRASHRASGGPSNAPTLTRLDESVANIMGMDIDPLAELNQDQSSYSDNADIVIEIKEEPQEEQEAQDTSLSPIMYNTSPNELQPECELSSLSPDPERPTLASPVPSLTGQAPTHSSHTADKVKRLRDVQPRRRIKRARQRSTIESQSDRSALMESLRIKEMLAEAALKNADSLRMIAESIGQCTQAFINYFQR